MYDRESLMKLWRHPSLSIHSIEVSGPAHSTVIPRVATASVSMRIVPDQQVDVIASTLVQHLELAFAPYQSSNTLSVTIDHTADWWLGRPSSAFSRAFADAIEAEWQTRPLWIREGGSIPSVAFLERTFGCEAVHLPIGQATDAAHLPNERIRILNIEVRRGGRARLTSRRRARTSSSAGSSPSLSCEIVSRGPLGLSAYLSPGAPLYTEIKWAELSH